MNNDLGFWRKVLLNLSQQPKTDADIKYLYRNLVRPGIPVNALWDAEKGAIMRSRSVNPEEFSIGDLRKMAVTNRGIGVNQTDADIPQVSPTGQIMNRLLGLDVLVVPEYKDMKNLWER